MQLVHAQDAAGKRELKIQRQCKERVVSRLLAALKQCGKKGELETGKSLHREAVEAGCNANKYVANALVNMYSKCGSMRDARAVFDSMLHRDVVLWTSLVLGYVGNGQSSVALELAENMDCEPDPFMFLAVIQALTNDGQCCLEKGFSIHNKARERGYQVDTFVANSLVEMYSKCRSMPDARAVFDSMVYRSVVSWTSLMLGYVENGESLKAMELFMGMDCKRDSVIFVAALKACTRFVTEDQCERELCLELGMAIHREARECGFERNGKVGNNLVVMYSNCGSMKDARAVFDSMGYCDIVSWNALILGYVGEGEIWEALDLFRSMYCEPSVYTFVALLQGCGNAAALPLGRTIHAQIYRLGLERNQVVGNSLVDFHGKCASMAVAEQVFDGMHFKDAFSWHGLISGYASRGNASRVFSLVWDMRESGLEMNGITFLSLLTSCSHSGMVDDGLMYFESMSTYGVSPSIEHYNCLVDMLGRTNRLQEALSIVFSMPFEPSVVTWTTLLGACKKQSNFGIGKVAFDALVASGHKDAAYVLMGDMRKKLGLNQPLTLKP